MMTIDNASQWGIDLPFHLVHGGDQLVSSIYPRLTSYTMRSVAGLVLGRPRWQDRGSESSVTLSMRAVGQFRFNAG